MRERRLWPPFIHSVRASEEGMHKLSLVEERRCQSPACNYNRGTDSVTSQHESPSLASDIEVQQEIWKEREVFCEKRPWCSNRIHANTFLFTICRKRELWYFREREERSQGFPLEEYPYLPVHICVCIIQPVTNANLFTPSYTQSLWYPYHRIIAWTYRFTRIVTNESEVTKGELHSQT